MDVDYKLTYFNALKADIVKIARFKIYITLLFYPILCMLMSYIFLMDSNATQYYSSTSILKESFMVLGLFILAFLPFLITTIMYSSNNSDSEADTLYSNSLIPLYVHMFSRLSVTFILSTLCIFIMIILILGQILYLNLIQGIEISYGSWNINKILFYLFLLPFLIVPFLEIIVLIQSYSKNILFSFILPLVACLMGNALSFNNNEYIVYSPINLPVTILKPIFIPFLLDIFDLIIVSCVFVASLLLFSYLIVIRGMKKI